MANKIYKGDVGTKILVDTGVDLTGVDEASLELVVKRPSADGLSARNDASATTVHWAAIINGADPTAGILEYEITTGDLPYSGTYLLQAHVRFTNTVPFDPSGTGGTNTAAYGIRDAQVHTHDEWWGETVAFTVYPQWG
jgi:hypothetical protein